MTELKGICTPVCTVFTEDGRKIDSSAFQRQLDRLLEAGVHIIAPGGGTGEFSFLTAAERKHVLEVAARHINGRAKLIAHTSAVMTEEAIEFAKHAEGLGADALLVLPPYFEGPSLDGVFEHYARVSKAVTTPVMAYNIPVHTGIDLDPEFYARLKQLPGIQYLKDSTGDFVRLQDLVASGVKVFVGGEPIMFHGLIAGASGCFWGTSNAIPTAAVRLFDLATAGDFAQADDLWRRLYRLNKFVWDHPFNPSVKAACNLLGGDVGVCRRPAQPLTSAEHAELEGIVASLEL